MGGAWIESGRPIAQSPAARYLERVRPGSRRTLQEALTALARALAGSDVDPITFRWERLTRAQTVTVRTTLKSTYAPATANKMLSALRGVLRAARDMGMMSEGQFQTAASLENIKAAVPQKPIATVNAGVLINLFAGCVAEGGAAGLRDAAMLAIFLSSGLRRAEAAALDVGNYDAKAGLLHIAGERPEYDRLVTLPRNARRVMDDWLDVRTTQPGPLLVPVDRSGLIRFRRMTDQAIYLIFERIVSRAGVPGVTLRDLRRAYVIGLIRAGKTMDEVQYLVGHASWLTTRSYEAWAKDKATASYDPAEIPYLPPTRPGAAANEPARSQRTPGTHTKPGPRVRRLWHPR
jgi:site-specific recombinase XerD